MHLLDQILLIHKIQRRIIIQFDIYFVGVILFHILQSWYDVTSSIGIMSTSSTRMEEAVAEGGPGQQVAFKDL